MFTNARVVTRETVLAGTVVVRGGAIAAVEEGRSALPSALDFDGDYLLPGLVELHTDNLERHFTPRPGVRWPSTAAVIAHDLQVSAAGITTVFDALAVGDIRADTARLRDLHEMADSLARAREEGILRAEHALHLRCEVSCEALLDLFEPFAGQPLVRLVSVMDHTPGQRQFRGDGQYRSYYKSKWNMGEAEIDALIARQRETGHRHAGANRTRVAEICRARGLPLASHDDATAAHIEEAAALGVGLAEFPTTEEAARAAHDNAIRVIAGAPNLVRGGSHSGNVSAKALGCARLVDILSSDYVPVSLLHAAFLLHQADGIGLSLPAAVATASLTPARAVGLDDRGEIAAGRAGDLVRVRTSGDLPIVRGVWRGGERVG